MFKTPERKEFPSRPGTLADNRPTLFDARRSQMVSRKRTFFYKSLRDIETWQMHSATPQIVAVPGIDRVVMESWPYPQQRALKKLRVRDKLSKPSPERWQSG